jgi:hypothetical protein
MTTPPPSVKRPVPHVADFSEPRALKASPPPFPGLAPIGSPSRRGDPFAALPNCPRRVHEPSSTTCQSRK